MHIRLVTFCHIFKGTYPKNNCIFQLNVQNFLYVVKIIIFYDKFSLWNKMILYFSFSHISCAYNINLNGFFSFISQLEPALWIHFFLQITVIWGYLEHFLTFSSCVSSIFFSEKILTFFIWFIRSSTTDSTIKNDVFINSIRNEKSKTRLFQVTPFRGKLEQWEIGIFKLQFNLEHG